MPRIPVGSQGSKIRNHHQVMTGFGLRMAIQRFCKVCESEGRAARRRPADPTLHGFRHLCSDGREVEEKGFEQTWIVV
jgi:hypothetical protein